MGQTGMGIVERQFDESVHVVAHQAAIGGAPIEQATLVEQERRM